MYGRRARDSRSSEVLGDNVNRAIEQLNSVIEKLERRVRHLESKIADRQESFIEDAVSPTNVPSPA
jgi:uncharacterized coiled-coil protein SlyX